MGTFRTLAGSDVDEILNAYGIAGHRGVTPIAAGTINTNFAIDLGTGRRFLRINEGKSEEDVTREAAIISHVAGRGVPTPEPYRARDGRPFLHWRGLYLSLFPWVEGRTLKRFDVGVREAEATGRALAQLHAAGADFPDRRPGRYEPDEIDRRLGRIAEVAPGDPALGSAVAELAPALARLHRDRDPNLPSGLIHSDLFIDNVLYKDGRLAALLDFEMAAWGRLVYDLAVSVLAFGFGGDDFRHDVTRAFIDGYLAVRPVSAAEARGFGAELKFACCRFAVTRITDVYLRRGAGAPEGKDFRRYLARLRAVETHLDRGGALLSLR
jgi:homoserine kinase type II